MKQIDSERREKDTHTHTQTQREREREKERERDEILCKACLGLKGLVALDTNVFYKTL